MAESQNYQVPYWIERLRVDYEAEEFANKYLQVKLLDMEGRKYLWWVCKLLGVFANGVPAQACQLLERCLSVTIMSRAHLPFGSREWLLEKQLLKARVPLLIVASVRLSAKMCCAQLIMNAGMLRERLMQYGIFHTVDEIDRAEKDVFKAVGFRVPLWTSVETAQMMAKEVGMSTQLLKGVALIIDLCEYNRNKLQNQLRYIAFATSPSLRNYLSHKSSSGNLRTVHLAAGAVAATGRHLRFTGPDPVPFLANITNAPQCYIKCICDIIIDEIVKPQQDSIEPPTAKRQKL